MAKRPLEYGDELQELAVRPLRVALDDSRIQDILRSNLEALEKQATALRKADYEEKTVTADCVCGEKVHVKVPVSFDSVAKAAAYTTKVIDEVSRLMSFVRGGPDSRPDMGDSSLLESLTDEQLDQVQEWVKENRQVVVN